MVTDLIVANAAVAGRLARKFDGRGCALEDLEQTALVALVKAAQRFEPDSGHDFLSYAVPCMTGEMRNYFRDYGWMVRPPRQVQELQAVIEVELDAPSGSGYRPSEHDVAIRLDIPLSTVRRTRAARGCFTPASLDNPVSPISDLMLAETLVDEASAKAYDDADARLYLAPALAVLTPADRRLLDLWFVDELMQK